MGAGENKIGILGCGWLGFPLGKSLLEKGYQVNGSTTSENKLAELGAAGIEPFLIKVLPEEVIGDVSGFLDDYNTLIIDFPPGIRNHSASDYISSIKGLIDELRASSIKNVLFISSISVYEDADSIPVYRDPDSPNATSERGKALAVVEDLLRAEKSFKTTILRLGGLIGPGRHPINQLAGRQGIANGEAPVNLIHLEDCIGIIMKILFVKSFGGTFNAVFPDHPSKEQYYQKIAKQKGLAMPGFEKNGSKGKIIDSTNIQDLLDYQFTGNIFR